MKVDGSKVRIALAAAIIGVLLGAYIGFSASPSTTFTISPGIYPGAPSYTVWREGSNYFAKNGNGELEFSGTNASQVMEQAINGGGKLIFVKAGVYELSTTVFLDESITIEGEGSGPDGTKFIAAADFTGDSLFKTKIASDDLQENINMRKLRIDGNSLSITGINLTNIACGNFEDIAVVDVDVGFSIEQYGTIPPPVEVQGGGVFIDKCRIRASQIGINIEYQTQCWLTNNWFVSGADTQIRIFGCDKIHGSNNEINQPADGGTGILVTDDGNPSTHDINFDNTWIYASGTIVPINVTLTNWNSYSNIRFTNTHFKGFGAGVVTNESTVKWIIWKGSSLNNKPFERSKTSVISDGQTSVTIEHLLAGTPSSIVVTPSQNVTVWVTGVNATHFTINCSPAASGSMNVYWYAEYKP